MRKYELTLILRSKLDDKGRKKVLESVKGWIKDLKITKEEEWGQKPLSYPIKKEQAGYYVMLQLEGENLPVDVERRLFLSDDVLRHLLIRTK